MKNEINIAELLKDCPTGMELDCLLCNSPIALVDVAVNESTYPIKAVCKDGFIHVLTKYGAIYNHDDAKCVIFPKGKTTWEGFVPPCKFKDGDVVVTTFGNIAIISNKIDNKSYSTYCKLFKNGTFTINDSCACPWRLATEEEKEKLFKAIKDNGYKWNPETKTLEKLVEPKFNVGDRIKYKNGIDKNGVKEGIILSITYDAYDVAVTNDMGIIVPIANQDNWELVPNKFDINTLVPFESRVLVRGADGDLWKPAIYGFSHSKGFYVVGGIYWRQCIPYEGNEHLRGKTDDCDDFYKNWE